MNQTDPQVASLIDSCKHTGSAANDFLSAEIRTNIYVGVVVYILTNLKWLVIMIQIFRRKNRTANLEIPLTNFAPPNPLSLVK